MYAPSAVTPADVVMKSATFTQRHPDHRVPCCFGCFPDRFWHLAGFAVTKADSAFLIPNNNKRGKSKTSPALDDLCHPVDVHQLVNEFAVAIIAVPASFSCHTYFTSIVLGALGALET